MTFSFTAKDSAKVPLHLALSVNVPSYASTPFVLRRSQNHLTAFTRS